MGGTGEGARETVPRPWRMRGILSSFATGTDRFLEHARFDRGPWLVVAFASGMAALTAVLLAARADGGHVVATRPIYGTTDHLLTCELMGMEVTWTTPDGVPVPLTPGQTWIELAPADSVTIGDS